MNLGKIAKVSLISLALGYGGLLSAVKTADFLITGRNGRVVTVSYTNLFFDRTIYTQIRSSDLENSLFCSLQVYHFGSRMEMIDFGCDGKVDGFENKTFAISRSKETEDLFRALDKTYNNALEEYSLKKKAEAMWGQHKKDLKKILTI